GGGDPQPQRGRGQAIAAPSTGFAGTRHGVSQPLLAGRAREHRLEPKTVRAFSRCRRNRLAALQAPAQGLQRTTTEVRALNPRTRERENARTRERDSAKLSRIGSMGVLAALFRPTWPAS